jgi:hypothetical protein
MENFKDEPVTIVEIETWYCDKTINPRTGRKISPLGKIYNYLNSININELYILSSVDDKDPISLSIFWTIENNKKKIVYENIDNIIYYCDNNNLIRCFEKETIEYMKGYNINKHPITNDIIPDNIFNDINGLKLISEREKSIEEIALDVFQLFTQISFFIDYQLFLELSKDTLIILYYEIKDFYQENLSIENRQRISNNLFLLSKNELNDNDIDFIKRTILENMKILLECEIEEFKFLINYILVGGLGLVIPQVKKDYPDFSFSFIN